MNFTPSTSRTSETLYLSAPAVVELVRRQGLRACLQGIADNIQADFLRWADFDKTARVASHSRQGVIELMPIADEVTYSFKYVNGHPGCFVKVSPTQKVGLDVVCNALQTGAKTLATHQFNDCWSAEVQRF